MRFEKVTCDGCGDDLTTRSNCVDYRLVLASESKPGYGAGCYTAMMIYPAIKRTHHFCDLKCLDHWRNREQHYDKLWKKCWDTWVAEKGKTHGNWSSYPEMPDDVRAAHDAEFRAAALAEFPLTEASKEI